MHVVSKYVGGMHVDSKHVGGMHVDSKHVVSMHAVCIVDRKHVAWQVDSMDVGGMHVVKSQIIFQSLDLCMSNFCEFHVFDLCTCIRWCSQKSVMRCLSLVHCPVTIAELS